jgi:hypothetical protein
LSLGGTVAKRARHADEVGITPAKPGAAQAELARRARNVRVFYFLICDGIVEN